MKSFVVCIIGILLIFSVVMGCIDPTGISEHAKTLTMNSKDLATVQLDQDPSLMAACHMEYWDNETHIIQTTDSVGIHNANASYLNYVCYYRDGHVGVLTVGSYQNYISAELSMRIQYNGYQGNLYNGNGEVMHL